MTPPQTVPDPVTLELAHRIGHSYALVHHALGAAAEVGIAPEKAARLIELAGPIGLVQFVDAYKGSLAYDVARLRKATRQLGRAIADAFGIRR